MGRLGKNQLSPPAAPAAARVPTAQMAHSTTRPVAATPTMPSTMPAVAMPRLSLPSALRPFTPNTIKTFQDR